MHQPPSPEDLERVTSALLAHGRPTITGAVLGTLIRRVAPDLDLRAAVNHPFGTGALARFTDQFLSHVLCKVGQTGNDGTGDNVYELIHSDVTPAEAGTERGAEDYWNSFVRPSATRNLMVVKRNGGYYLCLAEDAPSDCGVPIPKVSAEELKGISDEFLAALSSRAETAQLAVHLGNTRSYSAFIQVLKEAGTAFFLQWSKHRRDRLRATFVARLEGLGLSLEDRQQLLSQIDESQEAAREEAKARRLTRAIGPESGDTPLRDLSAHSTHQARELLKAVVDRMSTQEIRGLSIPIGHLLDALQVLQQRK